MDKLKKYVERLKEDEALENFNRWFNEFGIRDDYGNPKVLYSGTLSDFEHFDITKTQPETFWGQGFYFSDSADDASYNYATHDGRDHVNVKENLEYQIKENLTDVIEQKFQDVLNNDDDNDINKKIKAVYASLLDNEDVDDDLYNEVVEHILQQSLKRKNDGFIFPVFAAPRKIFDMENHLFTQVSDFGELNELINFLENYEIGSEVRINIESIPSELGEECEITLDTMIDYINEAADCYCLDEDDLEVILNFTKEYFSSHDDIINFEFTLKGELNELKDTLKEYLEDNGFIRESLEIDNIFFSLTENYDLDIGVKIGSLIDNEQFTDLSYSVNIPVENDYNQYIYGNKAIIAQCLQKMGYDAIKMLPENHFKMDYIEGVSHYIFFNPNIIKSAIGNNGEYSLSNPDILHRVTENAILNKNISLQTASKIIHEISLHYKNLPHIYIHEDIKDLPSNFKSNLLDTCSGWTDINKNSVHLYLANIVDETELKKTICHEVFGHLSLREILGNNYENTMMKVYSYYDSKGEMESIKSTYKSRYNLDMNSSQSKSILAEEKMAEVIELNGFNSFPLKNILIGAIKSSIRKVIPSFKMSNDEIQYIIYKSHKNMLNKKIKKKTNKINVN